MRKVLIIGASGFIGKELHQSLKSSFEVYGISKSKIDTTNFEQINILDRDEFKRYMEKNSFDIVINLVSILAQPNNLYDINVLQENINLTESILEVLNGIELSHFINFSSSSIYSNTSGSYAEDGLVDMSNNTDCIYGLSKFNSEMLFNFFLREKGVPITTLRVPMVYGTGMNESRIHKVFESQLEAENKISLWGNGERIISHISINELCQKVLKIIDKKIFGTYNLMGESLTTFMLAKRIISNKGNKSSELTKIEKGSKAKFKLDGTKLNSLLND